MPKTSDNAVALTQKQLKELAAGRSEKEIGQAIKKMIAVGRRPKELDLDKLAFMRRAGCSITEIAAVFRVSEKTIDNKLKNDPLFREIFENGEAQGRAEIKMAQRNKGVGAEDTQMLIWLGKVKLGQVDTTRRELTGKDGAAITFQRLSALAEEMTDEELDKALAEMGVPDAEKG